MRYNSKNRRAVARARMVEDRRRRNDDGDGEGAGDTESG